VVRVALPAPPTQRCVQSQQAAMFLILSLGVVAFLLTFLLTPLIRDHIGPLGFLDHPDGDRKKHAIAIPCVGGIAIAISYAATFGLALVSPFSYAQIIHAALPTIWKFVVPGLIVLLTGVLDDLFGFKAWQKLVGIGGAAAFAVVAGISVNVHVFQFSASHPALNAVVTVIWLIGCTNAFNLIDGMDGLATGVGLFASGTMLVAGLTQGNLPLVLAIMPLVGCLIGFLRYNFHPASVFLGDSGSLLIGFLLGCFGAFWSEKSVALVAMTVPLLAVSVPLLDVVLSILRRFLRNRSIFQGDRGHIHHMLLEQGFSPKVAVLIVYGLCALVAGLSLLSSALHNQFTGLIVLVFCVVVAIFVRSLGYVEFIAAGQILLKGGLQRMVDSEARLTDLERALTKAADLNECWHCILEASNDFGFRGVRMSIAGQVFEHTSEREGGLQWQLRIPLKESHYINFTRDLGADLNPVVLSGFVGRIESGLRQKLVDLENRPVRIPVASAPAHAVSARESLSAISASSGSMGD
jgi:UDP-GlcNAc:undecaprenyl-phosphate GlcNAc-1-phosphate transferase